MGLGNEQFVGLGWGMRPDGRVLLVKRRDRKNGKLFWALPGGKMEFNEQLIATCEREMKEELTVDVKILCPLGDHRSDGKHYGIFLGRIDDPDNVQYVDREFGPRDFLWLAPDEIRSIESTSELVKVALRQYKELGANSSEILFLLRKGVPIDVAKSPWEFFRRIGNSFKRTGCAAP